MKYISRKDFDIKRFIEQNKEARFAEHLEPLKFAQWTDYPYLYRPIGKIDVKYFNLNSSFMLHYANETNFLERELFQLIIDFNGSRILIKAHCPNEYWFYDFNKLNKESSDKISNLVRAEISEMDEKKGLLVEHGWLDIKHIKFYNISNADEMFKLIRHPEFGLYQPHMKIEAFGHSFYIELPDNPICKQKFNEWLEEHTDKRIVEAAINKLEND